jgi:hypothetical protein
MNFNMDMKHYGIELLRVAETKGMTREHALSIYKTYKSNLADGWTYGNAVENLKCSIFHSLYPTIELSWGSTFCDKCDKVILENDCVHKNEYVKWCPACEKKLQDEMAERRSKEEEEKRAKEERDSLEDEEKRKNWYKR